MAKDDPLGTGKEVLEIEAQAIKGLISKLDENFVKAVELLFNTKARVIVSGMGKSGIIGRKIAATLASCGTPAFYIHPAEAGHGDLGMIHQDDVLIAISYSGETKEIIYLLDFIKRIGIKLIGITGDKNSTLAQYSDVVLDASVEREAGSFSIVPTSSSTAALALGDALSIALMQKKGFNEDFFAFVHPKGEIGKKLMKVENLMHRGENVPFVFQNTSIYDVLEEMSKKRFGMTCVIDEHKKLLGIITDGDLRRMVKKYKNDFFEKTAKDFMTGHPVTIPEGSLATEALNLMEKNKITSLIIQDKNQKIKGIIHLHDLWKTEMF